MEQTIDGISMDAFSHPVTIGELYRGEMAKLTTEHGNYLVLRPAMAPPQFLKVNPAHWHKGENPTVPLAILQLNWIEGATVLYIGKAEPEEGLRRRVTDLLKFGHGEKRAHWGGRFIWQLGNSDNLLVRWRPCAPYQAEQLETDMIKAFKAVHGGRRPFANLSK